MAIDTIKFKRGVKSKLNNLSYGEPAYISDENELYIGTENGVEKITRNKEVAELSSQLEHTENSLNLVDTTLENISNDVTMLGEQLEQKVNKHDLVVNVKDFGAKGDGVDDTIAIEKAVEYVNVNGGNLFFPIGIFVISKPITLTKSGVNVIGVTSGWGDDVTASTIKAKEGFVGEYLIGYKGEMYGKVYSRSMGMKNININCNSQHCKAIHVQNLYDGSVWENINITKVNPNYRIFESISTFDNVCQTVTMNNIFGLHSTNIEPTDPAEGFYGELWYECVFTNCKFGSRGNSAFKMVGGRCNTYINCSYMGNPSDNSVGLDLYDCGYINIINPTFESPKIALNVDGSEVSRGIKLNNPRCLFGEKVDWEVKLNNSVGCIIDLVKPQSGGAEANWKVSISENCKKTVIYTDDRIDLVDKSEDVVINESGFPLTIETSKVSDIVLPLALVGRVVKVINDGNKNQYIASINTDTIEGHRSITIYKGKQVTFSCIYDGVWTITSIEGPYNINNKLIGFSDDEIVNCDTSKQLGLSNNKNIFTNINATGYISLNLPNPVVGLNFKFIKMVDKMFDIIPSATSKIRGKNLGEEITITEMNKVITLYCFEEGVWDIVTHN